MADDAKEKAEKAEEILGEIMHAFPKRKLWEYLGHFNDLFLFFTDLKRKAAKEHG